MKKVSIIGVGKVGITLAAALLREGFYVYGYDVNRKLISNLKKFKINIQEPYVKSILKKKIDKIEFSTNIKNSVIKSDTTFIIVQTNSNKLNGFSNQYILNYLNKISPTLKRKKKFHTFSLVSTVIPKSCDLSLIPFLEKKTKKKAGKNFGFCYNPSFIAQGEILKGISHPMFALIGSTDNKSKKIIFKIYKKLIKNNTPIKTMKNFEAEVTKLASNTFETMRVSFANMLGDICDQVGNSNIDIITSALSIRAGTKFFRGGPPYGGPCWPRDNKAFSAFLKKIKVNDIIPKAIDNFNTSHKNFLINKIDENINKNHKKIGIIGAAYKLKTNLFVEAFSINVVNHLIRLNKKIFIYDKFVNKDYLSQFKYKSLNLSNDIKSLKNMDFVIILQPYKISKQILKNKTVLDLWRISKKKNKSRNYFEFGNSKKELNTSIKKEILRISS